MIIDVRELNEYEEYHIEGSTLLPLSGFPHNIVQYFKENPLSPNSSIILMCRIGRRAELAKQFLVDTNLIAENQIQVYPGGILAWNKQSNSTGQPNS